jgi:hypothetical protein
VLLDHNRIPAGKQVRIMELQKKWNEVKDERKLMKNILGARIKEIGRQEEDIRTMSAFCINQQLKLTRSECRTSRIANRCKKISRTCKTATLNETSNVPLTLSIQN